MTENKYACDPWHKELIWIHTRKGFISILFLNIAIFSLFNFHKSFKNVIYHDILKYERANRSLLADFQASENNCTTATASDNCRNLTALLRSAELHELLEFRTRVYDFIVYSVFMTVSLWLLATVYRTSYEKTYFNALIHNCLLSYDLVETLVECKSDFLKNNPRPSSSSSPGTHVFVSSEEYGLHTFLRDDLVFGKSQIYSELKESLEDIMLRENPLPFHNPYFLFIHVVEWIHDLLRAVKMMHKKNVYHLNLQPKNVFVHWLQSTAKTDYKTWLDDTSKYGCVKTAMKALFELDKYEYADKRHIVLASFEHAVKSENAEVPSSAVAVPEFYRPPECSALEIVNAAKVDAWCVGVIAYELLTGGMLTIRASRYPADATCEEILAETLNKEFVSTAMHTHYHVLHCFLDIRFMQKQFKSYDLDQTVFATDCWTFLAGLLKSNPRERLSVQQALRHPLMKRVRKQAGKIYYINYPL